MESGDALLLLVHLLLLILMILLWRADTMVYGGWWWQLRLYGGGLLWCSVWFLWDFRCLLCVANDDQQKKGDAVYRTIISSVRTYYLAASGRTYYSLSAFVWPYLQ